MKSAQNYMMNTFEGKWVFDSNLLVYALDNKSPYHAVTIELFKQFRKSTRALPIVAQQNILEAENVLVTYYHLEVKKVIYAIEQLLNTFQFEVITPLPTTYLRYHIITESLRTKTNVYDYFLAATMLDNDIASLITANDKDFVGIEGLSVYNPFKKE